MKIYGLIVLATSIYIHMSTLHGMNGDELKAGATLCDVAGDGGAYGSTGGAKRAEDQYNASAILFNLIGSGRLAGLKVLLDKHPKLSNCSYAVEDEKIAPSTLSPIWYAFFKALSSKTVYDRGKYFEAMKVIFEALKQCGRAPVYVGEQILEHAPVVCCLSRKPMGGLLHYAVDQDVPDVVDFLVTNKIVTINETNTDGHNALAFARSVRMAHKLIALRIDVNNKAEDGKRAEDVVDDEMIKLAIRNAPEYVAPGWCNFSKIFRCFAHCCC